MPKNEKRYLRAPQESFEQLFNQIGPVLGLGSGTGIEEIFEKNFEIEEKRRQRALNRLKKIAEENGLGVQEVLNEMLRRRKERKNR